MRLVPLEILEGQEILASEAILETLAPAAWAPVLVTLEARLLQTGLVNLV